MDSELEDRRQRAREAFADSLDESAHVAGWPTAVDVSTRRINALNDAIETATRVQITPEMVQRGYPGMQTEVERSHCSLLLANALRAAGFEVVEP